MKLLSTLATHDYKNRENWGNMKTDIHSEYDLYKWEFYHTLKKRNVGYKGDIRALVGLLTCKYEKEKCSEKGDKSHTTAFCKAVNTLRDCRNSENLQSDLKHYTEELRNGNAERTFQFPENPLCEPPIKNITNWHQNGHNFISLFSGAFGLDLGFMGAGFNPLVALDIEESSKNTLEINVPNLPFIKGDISEIKTQTVLDIAGLDVGELDVLTGGPPCQPFSTAGKREGMSDPRASPLREFIRFVNEAQPKFFVMEEVTGLLSARLKHIPISERNGQELLPEQMTGSVFKVIVEMLQNTGYSLSLSSSPALYKNSILNAADYGAPQIRNRIVIIGSRCTQPYLPPPTHSEMPMLTNAEHYGKPWNTFWDATCDLQGKTMQSGSLSKKAKKYLSLVPPGGNWRDLPLDCVEEAMGKAYTSGGGKMGFFRRLSWDYPSPTVTTAPAQAATMLCHPEELRPLSVEEYKRIQGFPDDWEIPGAIATKYKLIGNAVPVYLSYAIANQVADLLKPSN